MSAHKSSALRQRMIEDMQLKGMSRKTIEYYVHRVQVFAEYFKRSPSELGPDDCRAFLLHLAKEEAISHSTFRGTVAALRFLSRVTLKKDWVVEAIRYQKRRTQFQPMVLSVEEMKKLLSARLCTRDLCMILLAYSAGLRSSEVLGVRVADIDSQRMLIRVRHDAKGEKTRVVPLAPVLLEALRAHYREARPSVLMFTREDGVSRLGRHVFGLVCKAAREKAGLQRHFTPHSLRHTFATHLLEARIDLLTIKSMLGHARLSTTAQYAQVTSVCMAAVPGALEALNRPA